MPAIDLTQGPQTLSRFDVLGQLADGEKHFIKHVGLLDTDTTQSIEAGGNVSAVHMKPPLEQEGDFKVDVAGNVPLNSDEIKIISTWIEKIIDELPKNKRKQYIIRPPWKDECDVNTGVRRYRRYSCVGFVLDSHQQVQIELLKVEESALPDTSKKTLMSVYFDSDSNSESDLRRHQDLLLKWGLEGNGPWKVVLPGFVLNALNRPTDQIRRMPYKAKEGDEKF